ncbi:MAG TPA: hypothetical protein VFN26_11595 [Candidatus Acidoferrum sp.]|nr:hypothetical protein [Candidatus Acidoferrum sp.]
MFNKNNKVESIYSDLKKALDTFVNEMAATNVNASTIAEDLHNATGIPVQTAQMFATAVCRVRNREEANGKRPVVPWGRPTETRPAALTNVEQR